MPTRRFELAQLLVGGHAVVFGLIGFAQAQPGYVPPPTPVFDSRLPIIAVGNGI